GEDAPIVAVVESGKGLCAPRSNPLDEQLVRRQPEKRRRAALRLCGCRWRDGCCFHSVIIGQERVFDDLNSCLCPSKRPLVALVERLHWARWRRSSTGGTSSPTTF